MFYPNELKIANDLFGEKRRPSYLDFVYFDFKSVVSNNE